MVAWRHEVWSNGHGTRPGRAKTPALLAATLVGGALVSLVSLVAVLLLPASVVPVRLVASVGGNGVVVDPIHLLGEIDHVQHPTTGGHKIISDTFAAKLQSFGWL